MKKITLREFLHIQQALTDEVEMTAENFPKPSHLCGRQVPNNLDSLMFEQLCRLQSIRNVHALLLIPPEIVLGLPAAKIMRTSARDAIGFALWVGTEIERINKLFQSTIVNPTKEEIAAGIERLRFGPFGMVDWFAQRMHIADHDQVMALPWLRLYECARIDARRAEYERRLRDIYQQKNKL